MIRRHQMLAAVFDPFHRLSQIDRGEGNQKIFRIKLAADAKATADIVLDEVQLALGHFEKSRDGLPIEMGQLGYAPNRQLSLAAIEGGDQTSSLQGIAGEAVYAKLFAPGVLGVLKSFIGVANRKLMDSGAIASSIFAEQDVVLQRLIDVYHRGQVFVFDLDVVERVFGNIAAFSHGQRHRLADVADFFMRQQGLEMSFESGKLIHPNRHGHRQRAEILEGEHLYNSRELKRVGCIDRANPRMGAWAAQDGSMKHFGQLDIVDVSCSSGNEAKIFAPLNRPADITLLGPVLSFHFISRAL